MARSTTGITIRNMGPLASAMTRLQQRLYQAPKNQITNVDPNNWPSAMQPVTPIAPKGSEPLAFPFYMGQNLTYTPRPDAEYAAIDLKRLANYPLARICIENTKDQLCQLPWEVQLKAFPGETHSQRKKRSATDPNVSKIANFLEYPDQQNCWSDWLRPLLEDMLVIDAASILVRKTRRGELASLVVVPGHNITCYIDDNGFRPEPPSPAFAQLWNGIPRTDLTTDQLIYRPRNIVWRGSISSYLYGMSPTEQNAEEIKIGIERLNFVLAYYTKGSVPGMLHIVPPGVDPDKIKETMQWMNSELAGNLEARRGYRMLQGFNQEGKPDQILTPKEPLLADPFDEMHIKKICFGYGTSPQRLMRMINRASASANQEAAEEEGIKPWAGWLKGLFDYIIQRKFGLSGYEIVFDLAHESDVVKQATADSLYVDKGIRTRNEIRVNLGDDPASEPEADQLGITTVQGFVPLDTVLNLQGDGGPKGSGQKKIPANPQKVNGVDHAPVS
jgi:hypothetical protein